jgi:hypothetical protein
MGDNDLDSGVLDGQGAGNLGGTTTVNNTVVTDQVADHAQRIV